MPGLTGHLLDLRLISRGHKTHCSRKRLRIIIIRCCKLSKLHKIRSLKQLLQLSQKFSRSICLLHIAEDLCSSHLHRTDAVSFRYILTESVSDAGIEGLLLFRSPESISTVLVKFSECDYMRRILPYVFRIMSAAVADYQPYGEDNQSDKCKSACNPWSHLGKCHRILYHSLDIMRLECSRIYRHRMYLYFLRREHQSIQNAVL